MVGQMMVNKKLFKSSLTIEEHVIVVLQFSTKKPCRWPKIYKNENLFYELSYKMVRIQGSQACTYRAPKILIRYTKKRVPKINSDVCFTIQKFYKSL